MTPSLYNVLIIGSGGREHTLAWKMAQSPLLNKLYTAPGNAGTAILGNNLAINENDFDSIKKAVVDYQIDLVVVGPEAPLVKGIVDYFQEDPQLKKVKIIGPPSTGAMLEGSKNFAKEFMLRHDIPTAAYKAFVTGQLKDAIDFLLTLPPPYVLKADGLAAGKGVIITSDLHEASRELKLMLDENKFGEAGKKVIIESFLQGIELSVFVLTDGKNYIRLPEAKDYKRIGEKDTGPNTGGMGSVSPVPFAGEDFMNKVESRIIVPTIQGLLKENIPYKGFIFFGLINVNGDPYVIEYNARMGDPETEVVMPRIQNDLLELFIAVSEQSLDNYTLRLDPRYSTCVMMVAPGYPGNYPKNLIIKELDNVREVIVFHAGTKIDSLTGEILSNGGRILGITALGNSIENALNKVYTACSMIQYEGKYYRKDIGKDIIK